MSSQPASIWEIVESLTQFASTVLGITGYPSPGATIDTPAATVIFGPDGPFVERNGWSEETIKLGIYLSQDAADPVAGDEVYLGWIEQLLDRETGLVSFNTDDALPGVGVPVIENVWAPVVTDPAAGPQLLVGRVTLSIDRSFC